MTRTPPRADLRERLAGIRARDEQKHAKPARLLDVDAPDLGDAEDLRDHRDDRPTPPHSHPSAPPPPIPAHLRQYQVRGPGPPPGYVDTYDHSIVDKDGPRYPDGVCARPDCWPCVLAALDTNDGWAGRARMARARREAGVPLDELDRRALDRIEK